MDIENYESVWPCDLKIIFFFVFKNEKLFKKTSNIIWETIVNNKMKWKTIFRE